MQKIKVHIMDRTATLTSGCWAVSTSINCVQELTSMNITSLCTQNKYRFWQARTA